MNFDDYSVFCLVIHTGFKNFSLLRLTFQQILYLYLLVVNIPYNMSTKPNRKVVTSEKHLWFSFATNSINKRIFYTSYLEFIFQYYYVRTSKRCCCNFYMHVADPRQKVPKNQTGKYLFKVISLQSNHYTINEVSHSGFFQ